MMTASMSDSRLGIPAPGRDSLGNVFVLVAMAVVALAFGLGLHLQYGLAGWLAAVVALSRWRGLAALAGLGASILILVTFMLPALVQGESPLLVAITGASVIMIVTLYLAHGVNEMTTAAVVGTATALVFTILLALAFIDLGRITGLASDDAVYARFNVEGLDLRGLVLAGLIIAALGVLDDVTVSQASTVFALHDTDRTLTWRALFGRAMRVGRDHIASVVNTLVLAYAGAALPLLLLFTIARSGVGTVAFSELVSEEIVRTLVGSIGLVASVPVTTLLAALVVSADRLPGAVATGNEPPTSRHRRRRKR
jgi:uncharacterized membrane protein